MFLSHHPNFLSSIFIRIILFGFLFFIHYELFAEERNPKTSSPDISNSAITEENLSIQSNELEQLLKTDPTEALSAYGFIALAPFMQGHPEQGIKTIEKIVEILDHLGKENGQNYTNRFFAQLGNAAALMDEMFSEATVSANSQVNIETIKKETESLLWIALNRSLHASNIYAYADSLAAVIKQLRNRYQINDAVFFYKLEKAFSHETLPITLNFPEEKEPSLSFPLNKERSLALANQLHRIIQTIQDTDDCTSAEHLIALERKLRIPFVAEHKEADLLYLADFYQAEASLLNESKEWRKALELGKKAFMLFEQIPDQYKKTREGRISFGRTLQVLFTAYEETRNKSEAGKLAPYLSQLNEELLKNHASDQAVLKLLIYLNIVAGDAIGGTEQKKLFYKKSLKVFEQSRTLYGDSDLDYGLAMLAAEGIADGFSEDGEEKEASVYYIKTTEFGKKALEEDSEDTDVLYFLGISAEKLAQYAENNNHLKEAIDWKKEEISALEKQVKYKDSSSGRDLRRAKRQLRRLERLWQKENKVSSTSKVDKTEKE